MIHRVIRVTSAFIATLFVAPALAQAPAWPSKPIRLVVPFAAGGSTEIMGRLIADKFTVGLGQPVVPENRAGAGGIIGSEVVAKAPPDGYSILLGIAATHAIQAALNTPLPYDILRDFAPIGQVAAGAICVSVPVSLPVTTLREFIDYAKNNPGKVSYGTGGIASGGHLVGEGLKAMAGIAMVHIPYKGAAPAFTDLLGGQLHAVMTDTTTTANIVKGGKIRVLAVNGTQRSPAFPDVPTMIEQGVPFEPASWFALFAPAKTPDAIIRRLNTELNRMLAMDDVRERLRVSGLVPTPGEPEAFRKIQQRDIETWIRVVKTAGIKVE
ncbi:MAG: Bug family tripartite tricarboxylate transporter substrate binding protein [Burkholderiales bacterium]